MTGIVAWGAGCLIGSAFVMGLAHAASGNVEPHRLIRWVIVGNAAVTFAAGLIVWQVIA